MLLTDPLIYMPTWIFRNIQKPFSQCIILILIFSLANPMSSLDYQAHHPPQIFRNTQFCLQEDSFWTFNVDEPFLLSQHLSKLGFFVDSKMFVLILESWPWPGLLNTNELSLIFWDPWYVVVNNILKMPAIQNLTSSSLLWFSSFFDILGPAQQKSVHQCQNKSIYHCWLSQACEIRHLCPFAE